MSLKNELIVALANKTKEFAYPVLDYPQRIRKVYDKQTNRLRTLLTNGEDKWVLVLASLMYGTPHLSMQLPYDARLGEYSDLLLEQPGVVTGVGNLALIANGKGPPRVRAYSGDDVWPAVDKLIIKPFDGKHVMLSVGAWEMKVRAASIKQREGEEYPYRVAIKWPKELGISGDLASSFPHTNAGFYVEITLKFPYPCELIVSRIDSDKKLIEVLEKAGVFELYHFSDSPREKVALAGYALYKEFIEAQPTVS